MVACQHLAVAVDVFGNHRQFQTDYARLGSGSDQMFPFFHADQHHENQRRGHDGQHVHAYADGHSDCRDDPYAGSCGQSSDRTFHLYDGSGAEETDAGDNLCGYSARVAVFQTEIFLRNVDRQYHSQSGAHRDEGEGAHPGHLSLAFALKPDAAAQNQTETEFEDRRDGIDLDGIDLIDQICPYFGYRGHLMLFFHREAARSQTVVVGKKLDGVVAGVEGCVHVPVDGDS